LKKILLATIVPFWNRETGAQQRIFALVKALEHHGHLVRVFFPGHADAADHELAERSNQEPDAPHDTPLRLSDFAWPWAEKAFEHAVTQFAPDAIICEYITMGYLVDALPKSLRSNIHCLVDTHDVLSQRQKQFADHHKTHWIDISIEEEAAALHCFDTIIAIQPDEAKQIEQMAPDSKVIVAGHQPHGTATANSQPANPNRELGKLTIGYLGSANASNVDAINHFLDEVWRQQKDASDIRLVIAGNVSDQVLEDLRFDNVSSTTLWMR